VEEGKDKRIYTDSAYTGKEVQECIPEGAQNRIHEIGHRDHPLSKSQERENKKKSHIRVRVEGYMTKSMGGITVRSIGKTRAAFAIGLMNLTYNINRYVYLRSMKLCAGI
jgi:IS5 family transposase